MKIAAQKEGEMAEKEREKERLIAAVKKEVKQLMEEAVTRGGGSGGSGGGTVHEDSGAVTTLCGAVEGCLAHGLRRRALGLFHTSTTTALLHRIAKHCPEAALVSARVAALEGGTPATRSASGVERRPSAPRPPLVKKGSGSLFSSTTSQHPPQPRYLWIRCALFSGALSRIVEHVCGVATRYYEAHALCVDPECSSILSSLLVGPCALVYSRLPRPLPPPDPPAPELVQRHRMSVCGAGGAVPPPPRTPRAALSFRRTLHTSADDVATPPHGKEHVDSLHQSPRTTLLYGKNNVRVHPSYEGAQEETLVAGYLSLQLAGNGGAGAGALIITWTPNHLMNGYSDAHHHDRSGCSECVCVYVSEVVYVHVHRGDTSDTLVLVGVDGVQRPPIHFPKGGHVGGFLGALEAALQPLAQLDPPLWSHHKHRTDNKTTSRGRRVLASVSERAEELRGAAGGAGGGGGHGGCDGVLEGGEHYVFRIITSHVPDREAMRTSLLTWSPPRTPRRPLASTSTTSSDSSSLSVDQPPTTTVAATATATSTADPSPHNKLEQCASIELVCTQMRRQIISRAFYGWLAYCRHLSTVRTHLSQLVHPIIVPSEGAEEGVTAAAWSALTDTAGVVADGEEVFRRAYYGGVQHHLRPQVWPYLLGYHRFGSTAAERAEQDAGVRRQYETTMSEWLCVEAIVRQRDKELTAASLARLHPARPATPTIRDPDGMEEECSMTSDNPPAAAVSSVSRAPSLDGVDNLEVDEETPERRRESIAEIKRLAEEIVPTGNGHPPLCSVDSAGRGAGAGSGADSPPRHSVIVTNPSVDLAAQPAPVTETETNAGRRGTLGALREESGSSLEEPRSACVSPASSHGGLYSTELVEAFALNIHRIDKDVARCDRNYWFFSDDNLERLRNLVVTYVWEHLDTGYMQGMCDLAAPLLVVAREEHVAHALFTRVMARAIDNFPCGDGMDARLADIRSLIQVLDAELFELMQAHGDYTHFYFCYRWILLDFKRELLYKDVFLVWEVVWAGRRVAAEQMGAFVALALLQSYRDVILAARMDFTDIIKFFNEMAERHDAEAVLALARDLVLQVQTLIENK